MKKIKVTFILFLLVILLSMSANADDRNLLFLEFLPDENYFSEVASLKADIVEYVNLTYKAMGEEVYAYDCKPITENDINFYKAYKEYVDFWVDIDRTTNLIEKLGKSDFYWVLPIQSGTGYYMIYLSRGLPLNTDAIPYLSQPEIETIIRGEGKWKVSGWGYHPNNVNPYEYLQEYYNRTKQDILNTDIYLVGTNFTSVNGALMFTADGKGYIKTIERQKSNTSEEYETVFDRLISADFFIDISNEISNIPAVDENGLLLAGAIGNLNDYGNMLISGDYFYKEATASVKFITFVSSSAFSAFLCLIGICFIMLNKLNR